MDLDANTIINAIAGGAGFLVGAATGGNAIASTATSTAIEELLTWSAHGDLDNLKEGLRQRGQNWTTEQKLRANAAYLKVEPKLHRPNSPAVFDV